MIIVNLQYSNAKKVQTSGTLNTSIRWLLTAEMGTPNFEMRYFEIGREGKTRYGSHPWEHEVFVLKGTGILRGENEDKKIKVNDAIYIAPNEPHQFLNGSKTPLGLICVIPNRKEDYLK